jgi:hypothetical protein
MPLATRHARSTKLATPSIFFSATITFCFFIGSTPHRNNRIGRKTIRLNKPFVLPEVTTIVQQQRLVAAHGRGRFAADCDITASLPPSSFFPE